jgi:hypothetical protein
MSKPSLEFGTGPTLCATALGLAITAPTLVAYNVSPSATFYNQVLALALWGTALGAAGMPLQPAAWAAWPIVLRHAWAPLSALALMLLAGGWRLVGGHWPSSLAWAHLGVLLAAAAVLCVAISLAAARAEQRQRLVRASAWALLAAGLASAPIAAQQMFAPQWSDGVWLATVEPGRAIGNLRQPNQLGTLALWALVGLAMLHARSALRGRWAALCALLLVAVVVWSASRTAVVGLMLLALWGAFGRSLAGRTRVGLLLLPLCCALLWGLMHLWAQSSGALFTGSVRVENALTPGEDFSTGRFTMMRQAWALLLADPWAGVGIGGFNFAWTLAAARPVMFDFFDHTHNLPMHLLVEMGWPLGGAAVALLLWALWQTRRSQLFWAVLMVSLHSFLEYPLWYAHFLLPTAWMLGLALGGRAPALAAAGPGGQAWVRALSWPATTAGVLMLVGALAASWDYQRVRTIFDAQTTRPLAERIAEGQRSWFFGHHADYAAITVSDRPEKLRAEFARPTQYLLDARLMQAWAQALSDAGEGDLARHLAQRLRAVAREENREFFSPCPRELLPAGRAAALELPFQCEAPTRQPGWHEYRALLDRAPWAQAHAR